MRVALLFPFLSLLFHSVSGRFGSAAVVLLMVICPWLAERTVPTLAIVPLFGIGAWLAQCYNGGTRLQLKEWQGWAIGGIGLLIYITSPSVRGSTALSQTLHSYLAGIGSILIISQVLWTRQLPRVLENRWLVRGGQASFGLYILHFPILMALAYLAWIQAWPSWCFQIIGFFASCGAALLLFHWVEIPMIAAGRKLTSGFRLRQRTAGTDAPPETGHPVPLGKPE